MTGLSKIYHSARAVGWENVPRRVWHMVQGKLGIDRMRLPACEISPDALRRQFVASYDPSQAMTYWRRRAQQTFLSEKRLVEVRPALTDLVSDECWAQHVTEQTTRLQDGFMRFFSHQYVETGWPPRFNHDPIHDVDWPTGNHWSTYQQFDPRLADLKCVWEASRFTTAYALARDFARSGLVEPARLFWEMFEHWDQQNPYGQTAQWACGQESSFRAMAWLFAALVTMSDPEADANQYQRLTELIWYTGRHIYHNINYARAQKNNHAISEGAMLWTIGLLFPELADADRWRRKGMRILAAEVERQIYEDGSYIQHSLNYHRVMLDDLLWVFAIAERSGVSLPSILMDRLQRSLHWLVEVVDPISGRTPNYGANDGAHVLPLSCCNYTDYRPAVQAAYYRVHQRRCFESGPWDEKALWLWGTDVLGAPVTPIRRRSSFAAGSGGYYVLRGEHSWAMTRIHTYRDRPVQADMLHVDLWFNGRNILRDAGSYHYFCAQPWHHYFQSTAAHNTIEIDAQDQMIKGPRFLWFRWVRSRLRRWETSDDGAVGYVEGEHEGYARAPFNVVHRRVICRLRDVYIILDDVRGNCTHDVALRWRLHPSDWRCDNGVWHAEIDGTMLSLGVHAQSDFAQNLRSGTEGNHPEGWESLYYADKTPTPTFVTAGKVNIPTRLITVVGPADDVRHWDIAKASFDPNDSARIAGPFDERLIRTVRDLSAGKILLERADQPD